MAKDAVEMKQINSLDDLKVSGQVRKLDPTEDAWEFGAPPKKGIYRLKLFPGKDCWRLGQYDAKDESNIFVSCNLECRIVSEDPEVNDIPVFCNVSTRVGRRKNISTMMGLIVKLGHKLKTYELTDKQLAKLFEKVLKAEPLIEAEIDWRGSYPFTNKKGEKEYKNVYNHYEEFPNDPEEKGEKLTVISVTAEDGSRVEFRPQLYVAKWYGKDEKKPEPKPDVVHTGKTTQTKEPDLEFVEPTAQQRKQATNAAPAPPQQQTQPTEEDIGLMLE